MTKILEVKDIVKSFGGLRAVDGVSLEIEKGSVSGLIGPNGSGKTTLFNTIAGIYKPDSGGIYYNGERIDGLPPYKIFEKGIVRSFQNPRLFFGMTVQENMLVPPRNQLGEKVRYAPLHWTWRKEETKHTEAASRFSQILELDKVAQNLASGISGGQMKLLEIGRDLMGDPELILLDEPTAGVAPRLSQQIYERIVHLGTEYGITFVIIEHRLDMLFNYVKDIRVMDRGRILAHGTPDDITKNRDVIGAYLGV
jgi:branched-chain amino acid transport system ATP-binding protein